MWSEIDLSVEVHHTNNWLPPSQYYTKDFFNLWHFGQLSFNNGWITLQYLVAFFSSPDWAFCAFCCISAQLNLPWWRSNAWNVSFETLYGGQFKLSTQSKLPCYTLPLTSTTVSLETYHLYSTDNMSGLMLD